jgi:F-type H+-transporting ATPase subunit alpha
VRSEDKDLVEQIDGGDWSDEIQERLDKTVKTFADDFGFDLDEEGHPSDDADSDRGDRDEKKSDDDSSSNGADASSSDEDSDDDSSSEEETEDEKETASA